jgi:MtaA/CmuA family methyltransferase
MNSYERYINTIKGETVDFLPRVPILMQFAAEYIGSNYKNFSSDNNVLVEANIKCAEEFQFDQLSCIADSSREAHGFGAEVTYMEDSVPRATYPLVNTKDLTTLLKPDPYKSERMFDIIKAVRKYKESFYREYSILGWVEGPASSATEIRTMTNLMMDLIEDRPFAEDLMDLCLQVEIDYAVAQIKAGCDTIGVGDAVVSQVSPRLYNKLIQPREKKLIKSIQDAGAYAKLHICGNITHLLPGIADLGIDIIDVDHMVDIERVRDALGNKVVITGNLDPVEGILNGNPEDIKEEFRRIYEKVGNPFMVNAGCEIPSRTPKENLKALCEPINYKQNKLR